MSDITAEIVRGLLQYDPETGVFVWRVDRQANKLKGKVAGRMIGPYWSLNLFNRNHSAHRVAWLYVHGEWPKHQIDHINGDKTDNRIANLRDVTKSLNMHNIAAPRRDSASGLRGVGWHRSSQKWRAQLSVNGRRVHLGNFSTKEEAYEAYISAKNTQNLPTGSAA